MPQQELSWGLAGFDRKLGSGGCGVSPRRARGRGPPAEQVNGLVGSATLGGVSARGPWFVAFGPTDFVAQVPTGLRRRQAPRDRSLSPAVGGAEARSPGRSPARRAPTGTPWAASGEKQPLRACIGGHVTAMFRSCHSHVLLMSQQCRGSVTAGAFRGHRAAHGQHAGVVSDRPQRARLGAADRADAALAVGRAGRLGTAGPGEAT